MQENLAFQNALPSFFWQRENILLGRGLMRNRGLGGWNPATRKILRKPLIRLADLSDAWAWSVPLWNWTVNMSFWEWAKLYHGCACGPGKLFLSLARCSCRLFAIVCTHFLPWRKRSIALLSFSPDGRRGLNCQQERGLATPTPTSLFCAPLLIYACSISRRRVCSNSGN